MNITSRSIRASSFGAFFALAVAIPVGHVSAEIIQVPGAALYGDSDEYNAKQAIHYGSADRQVTVSLPEGSICSMSMIYRLTKAAASVKATLYKKSYKLGKGDSAKPAEVLGLVSSGSMTSTAAQEASTTVFSSNTVDPKSFYSLFFDFNGVGFLDKDIGVLGVLIDVRPSC